MKQFIILAASLTLVAACSTTQQPESSTRYGPNPYRFDALEEVETESEVESEAARTIRVTSSIEGLRTSSEPGVSEFEWRHFGGNPFARNRAEAIVRFESFLESSNIPEELRNELRRQVQTQGETRHLVPGERLGVMVSGGVLTDEVVVHRNVEIIDTPGARAGLSQAIRAEVWTFEFEHNGRRYELELILPEVCYNWSIRIREITPPPPPAPDCAVVEFDVEDRDIVMFVVQNRRQALTSECWGVRMEGSAEWSVLPTRCDVCPEGWADDIDEGWPGRIHTSGAQGIGRDGRFQMRVPMVATQGHITFCRYSIQDDGLHHQSCSLTVEPRDWRPDDRPEFQESYFIEEEYWNFTGNCSWQRVS